MSRLVQGIIAGRQGPEDRQYHLVDVAQMVRVNDLLATMMCR